MITLVSLFLTLPQLVNTKFSTDDLTNENDKIKEYRYCRVAWEEDKIPISTRNLEMSQNYETQFGFNLSYSDHHFIPLNKYSGRFKVRFVPYEKL